jgi:fatty-acyl-CoA synthase
VIPAFDPLRWWGSHDPGRVAVTDPARGANYSYGALDKQAEQWSAALAQLGVSSGDRVAMLAQNRVQFLTVLAGANRLGAALVPLNWRLSASELARVLSDAAPSVLLGEERFRALAEEAVRMSQAAAPVWCDLDRDAPTLLQRARTRSHHTVVDGETAAMLLYTSGSTGTPKGVVMPHRQLHWNAVATNVAWELGPHDVGPLASPLFHTGGWGVFTLPLLFCGGRMVMFDSFDPDQLWHTMREQSITVAFGVPTQLDMLRERPAWGEPLPSLRWFIAGGAPCPQRVRDAVWDAGYNFREGYGLTECGPNCFTTTNAIARANPGTVGHPLPFLEMRLANDDGIAAQANEVGELQLRGPQLFNGYFNAPTLTAEVMTADGWLRTGDLALRRDDGVWAIRGRRKEMYISGGENVFPGEVEAALLGCVGVAEAAVIGVADERWGEVGCAVVVRAVGHDALSDAAIIASAREKLAGYKVPKRVVFADQVPKLGSGKIDRAAVRALIDAPVAVTATPS